MTAPPGPGNLVGMDMQAGWRWCNQCYCLCFAGFGRGHCIGQEGHNLSTSGEYLVPFTTIPAGAQPGWRWCDTCQGLVLADNAPDGHCFGGGTHSFSGSAAYSVPHDQVMPGAQEGWRWCDRCQMLWFAGGGHGGVCAAGGDHDPTGGGAYNVPTPASVPVEVRPVITVRTADGRMSVSGEGFTPYGRVHLAYLYDGRTADADTTANEAGRILHDEQARRGGPCMLIVRDESTGEFTADRSSVLHPTRIPLDPVPID